MKMELKEYKLGEIVSLSNGKKRPASIGEYPVYGGNGIIDYSNMYNLNDGVIIGRVGAYCGVAHRSKGKCWVTDNAIAVSAKHQVDVDFLYYLMVAVDFHKRHIGAAQPLMTQDIIENFVVKIPCMSMQKPIAAVLASIDRKIELNKAINANLETMAKQLYDYWFVQFDFPDSNGRPYKSSGGKMLYNPKLKRPIPAGWECVQIKDLIKVIERGISYSSEDIENPRGTPMINLACFSKDGNYRTGEMKFYSGKIQDEKFVMPMDMLVACTDMTQGADIIGRPIFASSEYDVYTFSTDLALVRPIYAADKMFLYHTLRTSFYHKYIKPYASGTNVKHLNVKGMENYHIPLPPRTLRDKFDLLANPIFEQINLRINEIRDLTALRDSLLPMLMNGQVSATSRS